MLLVLVLFFAAMKNLNTVHEDRKLMQCLSIKLTYVLIVGKP